MFFDEFYSEMYLQSETIRKYCSDMDYLVVIGTALMTGLSRQIVENALEKNVPIVELNTECQIRRPNVSWMAGKADETL